MVARGAGPAPGLVFSGFHQYLSTSVPRIGRLLVLGPVLVLVGKVRARLVAEVLGHIHGLLVAEAALAQREVAMKAMGMLRLTKAAAV